ncbi:MAG: hypothetical protein ABIJ09_13755 [Pseudomonadota bacterium]
MFPRPRVLCNGEEQRPCPGDRLEFDPVSGTLRYSRRRQALQLVVDRAGSDGECTLVGDTFSAIQAEAMAFFLARLGNLDGVLLRAVATDSPRVSFTMVR